MKTLDYIIVNRNFVCKHLKAAIWNAHSFRIGCATDLAMKCTVVEILKHLLPFSKYKFTLLINRINFIRKWVQIS